jgi:hypothetical protein
MIGSSGACANSGKPHMGDFAKKTDLKNETNSAIFSPASMQPIVVKSSCVSAHRPQCV